MTANKNKDRAAKLNASGLDHFNEWNIEQALADLQEAVKLAPEVGEYHLNLARAYARANEFDQAMVSLGQFLANDPKHVAAERFERLFSSALDEVETLLTEKMTGLGLSIQEVGKAIQMWLEYRITIGERPLRIPKPELWAAALSYAIIKVNFVETERTTVADTFDVSERSLRDKYNELVETLDLMPADYRYFTGEENPLDKLVEAAQLLEDMDEKFKE